MKTISGTEAINKMRSICLNEHAFFELSHLKFDRKRPFSKGMRYVKRCRLRKALPEDAIDGVNPDHYLPYMDLDLNEPRMAFKKLIRFVAFPPEYEVQKVSWFNSDTNGN